MTARQTQLAVGLFLALVLAGVAALVVQRGDGRSAQAVASASFDGTRVKVTWMGAVCSDESARLQVEESAATIEVQVRAKQRGSCDECLCQHTITANLDAPLGTRTVTTDGRTVRVA